VQIVNGLLTSQIGTYITTLMLALSGWRANNDGNYKEPRMPKSAEAPLVLEAKPVTNQLRQDLTARTEALRNANVVPRLTIATDSNDAVIWRYIKAKVNVGRVIGVGVEVAQSPTAEGLASRINQAVNEREINGVIVQLPITGHARHESAARRQADRTLLDLVTPNKDVDGLAANSPFRPATALGIQSLLRHYVPDYQDKTVALYGYGALVNAPLSELLHEDGVRDVNRIDVETSSCDRRSFLRAADIIIAATGQPGSLSLDEIGTVKPKIIIDAGTAERDGQMRGDVSPELRLFAETAGGGWGITPTIGGVGPMTVLSLHQNVIAATEAAVENGTAAQAWGSDALVERIYAYDLGAQSA